MWSVCSSFKLRGHRRTIEATKTPDPSETVEMRLEERTEGG